MLLQQYLYFDNLQYICVTFEKLISSNHYRFAIFLSKFAERLALDPFPKYDTVWDLSLSPYIQYYCYCISLY